MSSSDSFTVTKDLLFSIPLACSYITRLELWPQLVKRQEQEYIASLVPIDLVQLSLDKKQILGELSLEDYLVKHMISESDLDSNLHIKYALKCFSLSRFGPGLEEEFLSSNGGHDEVIYSLIRLSDSGLAQELWIRLEEGEASFSQLAESFGQQPESSRKGLFGPLPIGSVQSPDFVDLLRSLKPGQVHPPVFWGDWHVLIRLERLHPARFDQSLCDHLLNVQLNSFIDQRVNLRLSGQQPEPLTYDVP